MRKKLLLQGSTKIVKKNGTEFKEWCEINKCYNDLNIYVTMNSPKTVLASVYSATKNGNRAAFDVKRVKGIESAPALAVKCKTKLVEALK